MPYFLVRSDITKMQVDAIVNAANKSLRGGGGVDGCIHRAAGPELLRECITLGGCETGEAKLTRGYRLPCRYVIHTVGPIWHGGDRGEREALISCYKNSLTLAVENGCESVAFPLISAGVYGYPKDQALQIACDTVREFLADHDLTVYIVLFDAKAFRLAKELHGSIQSYIDERYVDAHTEPRRTVLDRIFGRRVTNAPPDDGDFLPIQKRRSRRPSAGSAMPSMPPKTGRYAEDFSENGAQEETASASMPEPEAFVGAGASSLHEPTLAELVKQADKSFTERLLALIDESGMSDSQCYKKANIDRKLFSKIRKDKHYKPSKATVLAFAIALELSLTDTQALLGSAGFTLSHSSKADIIIEYFIARKNYNIFEINEALFAFDQNLLGA